MTPLLNALALLAAVVLTHIGLVGYDQAANGTPEVYSMDFQVPARCTYESDWRKVLDETRPARAAGGRDYE